MPKAMSSPTASLRPTWPLTGAVVVGGWRFTQHSLERCREMGLDLGQVVEVLQRPLRSYPSPSRYGSDRRVSVDQGLAVVHTRDDRSIITVLWDGAEGR